MHLYILVHIRNFCWHVCIYHLAAAFEIFFTTSSLLTDAPGSRRGLISIVGGPAASSSALSACDAEYDEDMPTEARSTATRGFTSVGCRAAGAELEKRAGTWQRTVGDDRKADLALACRCESKPSRTRGTGKW